MKKILLSGLIGLSAVTNMAAHADTLGFVVGANVWQQSFSGDVQSGSSGDIVDINDTLGFDDETASNFYVAFEHPVPLIPNVRLARTELEVAGNETANFEFDGINYSGKIDSTLDLSHTDATLYYEILDNWVSIDIGITVRSFDEGFTVTEETTGDTSEIDIDGAIPMLYVGAKFELPLSGLYISVSGNGIGYDDASIIDYQAGIGYESDSGFGIEAGLRSFEIEYDDDDEEADLTVDGLYAGVFYHF
ncbi:MAG: outer membrane protein [Pseudohongiellaceae bacterium]|jgi:outer membrane protein